MSIHAYHLYQNRRIQDHDRINVSMIPRDGILLIDLAMNDVSKKIKQCVARVLMKHEQVSELERTRARTLTGLGITGIVGVVAHIPIFAFGAAYEGVRLLNMALSLGVLGLFIFATGMIQRGHLDAVISGFVVIVVGGICGHVLLLGELEPVLWLMVTVGLLSFLVRHPWQVMLIALTIMVSLTLIQQSFMNTIAEESLRDEIARVALSSVMLTALAYIKSHTHQHMLTKLGDTHRRTEQAALEAERHHQEMLNLLQEAREVEQFKSAFLEAMSHELRTPLNAILGYTELLHEDLAEFEGLPETVRSDTEMIQVASHHLLSMIVEVLDLEKIDEAEHQFTPVLFDLLETVQDVTEAMSHAAQSRHNTIIVDHAGDSLMIHQDPIWVRQLLFNFISNAIKFTAHGLIEVTLQASPSRSVAMQISDTGKGMSEQDLAAIREEFIQASQQSIKDHGGTGLGLPLCYALVERMQSTLHIESSPGKGTTVHVEFADISPDTRGVES